MNVDITPTDGFPHMYDYVNNASVGVNPVILIVMTFVVIVYYIIFSYLGISGSAPAKAAVVRRSPGIKFIEVSIDI